jgi:hypothetical protein
MTPRTFLRSKLHAIGLTALLISFAALSHAQSGLAAAATLKDPKLSTVIAELRVTLPQESQNSAPGPFPEIKDSSTQLPPAIREALHSRMLRTDSEGNIQVDVQIERSDQESLAQLTSAGFRLQLLGGPHPDKTGGEVYFAAPIAEGWLRPTAIKRVESLPFVRYIRQPDYGVSNSGSVDTQGDYILRAEAARSTFNIDGTGVRVGVISSGIAGIFATGCTTCSPTTNVPSPITLGDLPPAVGTRNASGILVSVSGGITATSFRSNGDLEDTPDGSGGAEGTAMLEIVHNLAPGASLYFSNAETSLQFEQAVDALASMTDVVVDDVSWFTPPFDGTSDVSINTSDALNNNANPIRAYFTDAGNWAQDHYQGMYADSRIDGTSITGEAGDLHLFQGAPAILLPAPGVTTDNGNFGEVVFDPVIAIPVNQSISVYLAWDDPELASTNDYDLFLVPLTCAGIANDQPTQPCTVSGQAIEKGMDPQTGVQSPAEQLSWTNGTGSIATVGIVIQNVGNLAQARTFDLFVNGYGAKSGTPNHNFNTVTGSITAQNDAGGGVVTVGAINQDECTFPDSCTGLLETYSSQGPTEVTPQSPNGSMKPDLVAVDQVCVDGAGGFNSNKPAAGCPPSQPVNYTPVQFGGTSAAAPHVAAISALVLEAAPCLLANDLIGLPSTARTSLRSALTTYAHSLPGYYESVPNSLEGFGLVDALDATMSVLPTANAITVTTGSTTGPTIVSATSRNGASVALSPTATLPNNCPIASIAWSGACGSGTTQGAHSTLQCPIGTDTVQVAVSNNGLSYQPQAQIPESTIVVTDFVISAVSDTTNVQPGATLLYTITAQSTAQGQFANPIALTCSGGLPAGATCSFAPTTINAANSTGTTTTNSNSTLTIYTSGLAQLKARPAGQRPDNAPPWYLACLIPIFLAGRVRSRSGLVRIALAALTATTLLSIITSCSRQTQITAPTTYTVTISGTSNQLVRSTTISFNVQ